MKENKPKIKRTLFRKIVNGFIVFFAVLTFLLIIFFGFAQTHTFREYLRHKIITEVNSSINGRLNIDKIEGTLITSIFFDDVSLISESDTIFSASKIEIKTSPLQLLLQKLYLRKIRLSNVNFNLLQTENGVWNISGLAKQGSLDIGDKVVPAVEDSFESEFPFVIQVNDLQLENVNFNRISYTNKDSTQSYRQFNTDNLRIRNINLKARAFADINKLSFLLAVDHLELNPNITNWKLHDLKGEFIASQEFAAVKGLHIATDSTDLNLTASLEKLNLFGQLNLENFKNYPLRLNLDAKSFNFNDLSSFIDGTQILKGNPSVKLSAIGTFGNFDINKLLVDYGNTHIDLNGSITDLHTPGHFKINAAINNSKVVYEDARNLLPTLEIPDFSYLSINNFSALFNGEPTNFNAKVEGNLTNGDIKLDCTLNLQKPKMIYDIKFETVNANLEPILGVSTSINSKGTIKGIGTDPTDLSANLSCDIFESSLDSNIIKNLSLKSKATNKIISLNLSSVINNSTSDINGVLDFTNSDIPHYDLNGAINNLNLAPFIKDSSVSSNLNFSFNAKGDGLDLDLMTGNFVVNMDSSVYRGHPLTNSRIILVLKRSKNNREINLTSDFVDFNIFGDFSLNNAIELLTYEGNIISSFIASKAAELNPIGIVDKVRSSSTQNTQIPDIVNSDIRFDYNFQFKDFDLIALILENDQLDISGTGKGSVINDSTNFTISTELSLDYMLFVNKEQSFYLSNVDANFDFSRNNHTISFNNLFGSASISGQRIIIGNEFKNLSADLTFNQSKLFFNTYVEVDTTLKASAAGFASLDSLRQHVYIEDIWLDYKDIQWINDKTAELIYTPDSIMINNLALNRGNANINLNGTIRNNGKQNLIIDAAGIPGEVLSRYIFNTKENFLSADGNLKTVINGTYKNPKIKFDLNVDNITYSGYQFGNLICNLDYVDKNLKTNIYFLDTTYNFDNPKLSISGNVPFDLSFGEVDNRLIENKEVNLVLKSSEFDISILGDVLPFITKQKGLLAADLKIAGSPDDLNYSGFIKLLNGTFRVRQNNLDYKFGANFVFNDDNVKIEDLYIANSGGSKFNGELHGNGNIVFAGLSIDKFNMNLNGDIAVLGNRSKAVSPAFYGDLLIGTDDNWNFTYENDRSFFKGKILLKQTDLIYTTGQEDKARRYTNFDYNFITDSTSLDKSYFRFQRYLLSSGKSEKILDKDKLSNFDYDLDVRVVNDAEIVFILSQVANQKLYVEARGDLKYESIGNQTRVQGAFDLLSGSKLEFFKTFDATGTIRFENDITNPYLDITATYTSEYVDPRDETATPQEIAVKIKMKGTLNELGKNLANNPDNIGVYVGSRNIQNNIRDTRYDYADAFSFILIGKFKNDLTASDKTQLAGQAGSAGAANALGSTATSFFGSILSNFVNSVVGDFVNNIQLSNIGDATNFNVSGKYQNIRYKFGGTTEVFQNINKANLKIEYLFNPNFLIRLERKDPVVQSYGSEGKITEIGLKYKFQF